MASQYDVAALMALFNMLKVNLCPENYRTLLAMLSDFDPKNAFIRKKIVKYIKLLIKDQMLLKCLLMSLPEGVMNEPRPLPKAEKILLPPKIRHKNVTEGLDLKSKVENPGFPRKIKHPMIATASCFAEKIPADILKHDGNQSVEKGSPSFGRCDETRMQTGSILGPDQTRPNTALSLSHLPSFTSRSMYPSILGIPAGMATVLPWQPINFMQSCYIGQFPSTSCESQSLMNAPSESVLGVDLTVKIGEPVNESSEVCQPDQGSPRQSISQPVDVLSSQQSTADRPDPAIKTVSPCQDLRRGQIKQRESVSRRNSDHSSLEALVALTSRIGHNKSSSNGTNDLRAKRSASTGSIGIQADSNLSRTIPSIPSSNTSNVQSKGDCNLTGPQSNKNTVKSFPYSQEIKLPDGKYFLLNSSADRKVLSLKSSLKFEQSSTNQNQNAAALQGISVCKSTINQRGFQYKWYPISDNTRLLRQTVGNTSITKATDFDPKSDTETCNTSDKLSQPPSVLNPGFSFGEGTRKIHLDNESTTKLITELLRKRARSESGLQNGGSGLKKTRLPSDSQMSAQTTQDDLDITTVGPQLYVKIDNQSVKMQQLHEIDKTTSHSTTSPSAPIIQTEMYEDVLNDGSKTEEKTHIHNQAYKDLIKKCTSLSGLYNITINNVDKPATRDEMYDVTHDGTNHREITDEKTTRLGEKTDEKPTRLWESTDEKPSRLGESTDEKPTRLGEITDEKPTRLGEITDEKPTRLGESTDEKPTRFTSPDLLTEWDFLTHDCSSSSSSELDDEVFDSVFQ